MQEERFEREREELQARIRTSFDCRESCIHSTSSYSLFLICERKENAHKHKADKKSQDSLIRRLNFSNQKRSRSAKMGFFVGSPTYLTTTNQDLIRSRRRKIVKERMHESFRLLNNSSMNWNLSGKITHLVVNRQRDLFRFGRNVKRNLKSHSIHTH